MRGYLAIGIVMAIVISTGCSCECPPQAAAEGGRQVGPSATDTEASEKQARIARLIASRPPLELRGIRIGFDKKAVEAARPGERLNCYDHKPGEAFGCRLQIPDGFGGYRDWFRVRFDGNELIDRVEVTIPDDFQPLVDAASMKFGDADADEIGKVQNRMGASFDQRVVAWNSPNAVLTFTMRSESDLGRRELVLARKLSASELAAARERAANAAARRL